MKSQLQISLLQLLCSVTVLACVLGGFVGLETFMFARITGATLPLLLFPFIFAGLFRLIWGSYSIGIGFLLGLFFGWIQTSSLIATITLP
jgi:hypothetical protein